MVHIFTAPFLTRSLLLSIPCLPLSSLSIPFLFFSLFLSLLSLSEVGSLNRGLQLRERYKLRSGVWGDPNQKSNFVHFILKIRHLMAPVLLIFMRINSFALNNPSP